MNWLFELHKTQPVAHAVGVLAFVCVVGMVLGSVKVRGVGLGHDPRRWQHRHVG
jgi:putative transport protein